MRAPYFLFTLFLYGCSATGPAFNESMLPKNNGAAVVVYRPAAYSGSATGWDVHIEDKTCSLHYASYWTHSGLRGLTHITAEHWAAPGTSRITVDAKSHGIYYLRLEVDGGKTVAGALGGVAGYMVAEGMASTGGPFIFTSVEPIQAKQELESLHQDCL